MEEQIKWQTKLSVLQEELDRLTELSQSYDDPDSLSFYESLIAMRHREINELIIENDDAWDTGALGRDERFVRPATMTPEQELSIDSYLRSKNVIRPSN
jgi:hypothetical protein